MTTRRDMAVRLVSVIAAALLVVAFSVALLFPSVSSLAGLISSSDERALAAMQGFAKLHLPDWAWSRVAVPMLVRPAWLLPMALGLIAVGVAVSLRNHQSAPRSRRRRS